MESVESQSACAAPAGGFAIVETSKNSFDVAVAKSASNCKLCRGIAKLVKALDFDSSIPRFESLFPCHLIGYAHRTGQYQLAKSVAVRNIASQEANTTQTNKAANTRLQ